jgi:hypothetical protein
MRVLAGHLIANCASLLHTKIKDKKAISGYFGGATHGYNLAAIGVLEYSRQVTVSVTTACSYSDFPCSYSFQLPRASLPPRTAGEGTTGRRCGPRVT